MDQNLRDELKRGEMSSYEEPERRRLADALANLKPIELVEDVEASRQWAKSALALYRRREESAELCLLGDGWRIEFDSRFGADPRPLGNFLGVPVWGV